MTSLEVANGWQGINRYATTVDGWLEGAEKAARGRIDNPKAATAKQEYMSLFTSFSF
jgi:hypothetical protein